MGETANQVGPFGRRDDDQDLQDADASYSESYAPAGSNIQPYDLDTSSSVSTTGSYTSDPDATGPNMGYAGSDSANTIYGTTLYPDTTTADDRFASTAFGGTSDATYVGAAGSYAARAYPPDDDDLLRIVDTADAGATDDEDDGTSEIRAGIEATRNDMSATIDAIQAKLNPEAIIEQAKDTVREATVGKVEQMVSDAGSAAKDTGSNLMDMVKGNPVPAAALGLGLAWLLMRDKGGSGGSQQYWRPDYDRGSYGGPQYYGSPNVDANRNVVPQGSYYTQSYTPQRHNGGQSQQGPLDGIIETIRQNPIPAALTGLGISWLLMNNNNGGGSSSGFSSNSGMLHEAQHKVSSTVGQAGDTVGQAVGQAQDKVGDAVSTVQDTAGQVQDKAGQIVGQAQDTVGQVASQVQDTAGQVVSQVTDTAGQLASQVQEKAGQVAGQAQETVGQVAGTTSDVVSQVLDAVRRNPVPAALGGLSIAWLFMNRKNNRPGDRLMRMAGYTVGGTVEGAGTKLGDVAAGTQLQAEEAKSRFQRMLEENPLGVGAITAGVGIALGLALPETEREHQLMGDARDQLLDKAQQVAQDTLQKVQTVAGEVATGVQETVKQEAQNQGLTPEAIAGQAQQS